ncbi:MAG: DUF1343 domain-containing protein [Deltaproteobacteria bacterium]|nr:DUF1343 domain-containing protein [Deltaproteobacteria bacterium]
MRFGIDSLLSHPPSDLLKRRWGLLSNQASINQEGYYSKDLLRGKFQNNLTCLFSPQHGFWGTEQDNMVETPDSRDPATGLPIYSLYSRTRRPTARMMEAFDVLFIDLQDVGTRVYTFITTLAYCLQECQNYRKKIVILDRPNPIGGIAVEGNILLPNLTSFVGVYPLPMRHGLTMGELARLFNQEMDIGADLRVIPMEGWQRSMSFDQTGNPWVMPSPNMPALSTALVYPGQVLLEGTNLSEGRGTTRPFEVFGAPFIDPQKVNELIRDTSLPGVQLIEMAFRPTFQKWPGLECRGFFLRVYDPEAFKPYRTSLRLIQAIRTLYPEDFIWKSPPYEYETERMPIDLLVGDQLIRQALEAGQPITELEASWQDGLNKFLRLRQEYLLYP